MAQGVRKGRFWVTEDVDTERLPPPQYEVPHISTDPGLAKGADETKQPPIRRSDTGNSQQLLSVDAQSSQIPGASGVQKKGRFFVVNDVSEEQSARPQNSSSETESLAEAQAQLQQQQQQQLLFPKDVANQTKASPPPPGESLRRDSSTSSVHSQVSAQAEIQTASAPNGYQKRGRFFVANDDGIRLEQEANLADQADDMKRIGSGSETESLGQPVGHVNGDKRRMDEGGSLAAAVHSNQTSQPTQPALLAGGQAPPTAPTQKKTIFAELQRIQNQNRKLHNMLRELMSRQGIQPTPAAKATPGSTSTAFPTSSVGEFSGEMKRRVTGPGGQTGVPKQHVASAADPLYLQGILSEVTHGTSNLIMEYNTLKKRNRTLTKQLNDTKLHLKEARSTIRNLRSQLGKHKAPSAH